MAVKQLGKKGMFLTFIAISLIAALIIIFTPSDINLSGNAQAIKTRVSNVNGYVLDLESVYLERTLQATGTKTIIALIKYMESQQIFFTDFTDFEDSFSEVLLDGTIKGEDIQSYYPEHNTYNFWLNEIKTTAKETFNIDTVYGISNIRVYQTTPWFINVDADISFNVSSETASWNKTAAIKTEIEIESFDDPYYLVNTGGSYVNKIRGSGTKFDEWGTEKVKDFIRDGNYTHWESSNAPSFLQKFTNDLSASSCCGIESLVNPNTLANLGLDRDKDVSYVDYLFWSTTADCDNLELYTVKGISRGVDEFKNFKLDFNHIVKYNLLDDIAEQICPPPE